MESRLLHSAAEHLTSVIDWNNDWKHFGRENEINFPLINELIDEYLTDEFLHFVCQRDNSGTFKRTEIINLIARILGHDDFQLWNLSMDKVIRFDHIGVLQTGIKYKNAL